LSDTTVHDPLIDPGTFERAHEVMAAKGAGRNTRERHRTRHRYVLRGLVYCGLCGRRMQWQQSREVLFYRCRFPDEYGLANKIEHPRNVYLAERDVLGLLDDWLSTCFAPHRLADTIEALHQAQSDLDIDPTVIAAARTVEECDRTLARHRAALGAGADPQLVAGWIAETHARRAEALSRSSPVAARRRMSKDEIRTLVDGLGSIRRVLSAADPDEKVEVYRRLNLQLTYQPGKRTVRVETNPDPYSWGYGACPRGDSDTKVHS
jgi:site-specific DNA recombinase